MRPNHGSGCLGISAYKEPAVYEQDIAITQFWQNDDIVWSQGIRQMDLVIKNGTGTKAHTCPDPEKFFPTKVRMTLIQVSAGAKYGPKLVPNLPEAGEKKQESTVRVLVCAARVSLQEMLFRSRFQVEAVFTANAG